MSIAHSIQELIDFTTHHLRLARPEYPDDYEILYVAGNRNTRLGFQSGLAVPYCQVMSHLRATVITFGGEVLYDNYFTQQPPTQGRYRREDSAP